MRSWKRLVDCITFGSRAQAATEKITELLFRITSNEQPANPSRAKAGQPLIVCTMLSIAPSWKWFAPIFDQVRWEFYGGDPRNWLEQDYAARLGVMAVVLGIGPGRPARDAAMVISHDGRVTSRVAVVARIHRLRVPHVAWGFNFTTLPRGPQRRLMAWAFTRVDRFIVYSTMERKLYAEYFGIDPRRVDVVLWGVGYPLVDPPDTPSETRDYICALGGNARDYRTLFAAMDPTARDPAGRGPPSRERRRADGAAQCSASLPHSKRQGQ